MNRIFFPVMILEQKSLESTSVKASFSLLRLSEAHLIKKVSLCPPKFKLFRHFTKCYFFEYIVKIILFHQFIKFSSFILLLNQVFPVLCLWSQQSCRQALSFLPFFNFFQLLSQVHQLAYHYTTSVLHFWHRLQHSKDEIEVVREGDFPEKSSC